jgi:hypothetical protein
VRNPRPAGRGDGALHAEEHRDPVTRKSISHRGHREHRGRQKQVENNSVCVFLCALCVLCG